MSAGEKLRAELERLCEVAWRENQRVEQQNDEILAERDRLRAENDRLRAALRRIVELWDEGDLKSYDAWEIAQKALEGGE